MKKIIILLIFGLIYMMCFAAVDLSLPSDSIFLPSNNIYDRSRSYVPEWTNYEDENVTTEDMSELNKDTGFDYHQNNLRINPTEKHHIQAQIVLEVSLSGDKQFTSIQDAIDFAPDSDAIILVHPGDYFEPIRVISKTITIQSLYESTLDTTYIHTTRLLAPYPNAVVFIGDAVTNPLDPPDNTVIIDGFTISNNMFGDAEAKIVNATNRTGLLIAHRNAAIRNNIFTKNFNTHIGSAINIIAGLYVYRTIYMENNQIFDNTSFGDGAGLSLYGLGRIFVYFSENNRNSIYNNIALFGSDISIRSAQLPDYYIYLDIGSRIISEIGPRYIYRFRHNYSIPMGLTVIDILQEGLPPVMNHDLYVSPYGNDSNTGLTEADPLKTIYFATQIIASDPLNPKTINLLPGVYSRKDEQVFPIYIPDWTRIKGAGTDNTMIDMVRYGRLFRHDNLDGDYELSDFTVVNTGHPNLYFSLISTRAKTHHITNIVIDNALDVISFDLWGDDFENIFEGDTQLNFNNVVIKNSSAIPMQVRSINSVYFQNFIIDNIVNQFSMPVEIFGWKIPNLYINNLAITNIVSAHEGSAIRFNTGSPHPLYLRGMYILNNVLIANNTTYDYMWGMEPVVAIENRWSNATLNNWTIANNKAAYVGLFGEGWFDMNNTILYNPDLPYELELNSLVATLNNSIIYQNKIFHNFSEYEQNNVIYDTPLFAGHFDDSLTPDKWEYYFLHESSPAINAGIDVSGVMSDTDLAGNPRIYGSAIDMGPFEFQGRNVNFAAEPRRGKAPLTVQFTCLSAEPVYAWEWDFDNDGFIDSIEQNPTFTYTENGSYTVSLTINDGEATITRPNIIIVGMEVDFLALPRQGNAPLNVVFACQTQDDVYAWEWDLDGDGIIDSTERVAHFTYTKGGSYNVTLTVNYGEASITRENFIVVFGNSNEDDETIKPFTGVNLQNFPNPVYLNRSQNTIISFDTPISSEKRNIEPIIEIFNIRGQKIKTLETGMSFYDLAAKNGLHQENMDYIQSRNYSVIWNMRDDNDRQVSSGVYLYRAVVNGEVLATKRMLVIK